MFSFKRNKFKKENNNTVNINQSGVSVDTIVSLLADKLDKLNDNFVGLITTVSNHENRISNLEKKV